MKQHRSCFLVAAILAVSGVDAAHADAPPPERAPAARRLEPSRLSLRRGRLGNETRYVLPAANATYGLSDPPAQINLAYGIPRRAWPATAVELELSIAWRTEGKPLPLWRRRVKRADGDRWHEIIVPLAAAAQTRGEIVFQARLGNDSQTATDAVFWTNPTTAAPARRDEPNVILISIDTLRADHLGCYGYQRDTSPNIDRLAREGILFRQAVASSSWTLPSHASMLTGLHPFRHGAVRFTNDARVRDDLDTLAERLWDDGVLTAAATGGGQMASVRGFDQGFDRYWSPVGTPRERAVLDETLARAKGWINANSDERFFFFLHTYAVHMPYAPPPPFDTMFDPAYRGPYKTAFTFSDWVPHLMNEKFDAATVAHLAALYDGEIRHLDTALGSLFDDIRRAPAGRPTCILVTSDHGDEFKEHGHLFHDRAKLFEELVRVPLIVWCPSRYTGGRVIENPVSLVDVTPTILDIAAVAVPAPVDGRSLELVLRGTATLRPRPTLSEVDGSVEQRAGVVRAVRTDTHKLIDSTLDGTRLLYDLRSDPGETRDVAGTDAAVTAQLTAALPPLPAATPALAGGAGPTPDAATQERLRALGYSQ